jgi:archaemetzincin
MAAEITMNDTAGRITIAGVEIVPLGELSAGILERVAFGLRAVFRCQVPVAAAAAVPEAAYQSSRGQYNASMILNAVRPVLWKKGWRRLAVIDVDLFAGSLNFVFGQADLSGTAAVISLVRLRNRFYGLSEGDDDNLLVERAIKEALHEIGHTLGLVHCKAPCVMYFSNSLVDTDGKSASFCGSCRTRLSAKEGR